MFVNNEILKQATGNRLLCNIWVINADMAVITEVVYGDRFVCRHYNSNVIGNLA